MDNTFKLSEILTSVSDVVNQCFSEPVWLEAEMASWKTNQFSGHAYGELVEHNQQGEKTASCRFTCWKFKVYELTAAFKRITGESLRAGLHVRLLVKLNFSQIYGFSANIVDIDPKFTLGHLYAHLQQILNQLTVNGFVEKNRQLEAPFDYFNVAVISSKTAAGLEDFKAVADQLHENSICQFSYFGALMQGDQCGESVIAALTEVEQIQQSAQQPFDCVVITRGGGSAIDLASFNHYDLAEKVCRYPLPVFCAIGHQQDQCIVDYVANKSFGTPSKVIHYIENVILSNAREIVKNYDFINKTVMVSVNSAEESLKNWFDRIQQSALHKAQSAEVAVRQLNERIQYQSQSTVEQSYQSLKQLYQLILANSIEPTLKKGYAIAQNHQSVVTSKQQAVNEGVHHLQFHDGVYCYGQTDL